MENTWVFRQAVPGDRAALFNLIEMAQVTHRHLDWRPPLDWLDSQPFIVVEIDGKPGSALACPTDPAGIAWIRLFTARDSLVAANAWPALLARAIRYYRQSSGTCLAAISLTPWFTHLLEASGFTLKQKIVVLEWDASLPIASSQSPGITIRKMEPTDLPAVTTVDNVAFDLLWQNTLPSLELASTQAAYATVAVLEEQIVGYQICTGSTFSAHLARLAVVPLLQNHRIGSILVSDLLRYFRKSGLPQVTVNTQSDNFRSLSLYKKMGFALTGDSFPVYILPVSQ